MTHKRPMYLMGTCVVGISWLFLFSLFVDFTIASTVTHDFVPCSGKPNNPTFVETQRLLLATSEDGINFTRKNQILADRATVPDAVVLDDGTILVYYVAACVIVGGQELQTNRTVVAISYDNANSWIYKYVTFNGVPSGATDPVDPNVVLLPNGNLRLFTTIDPRTQGTQLPHTYSFLSTDRGLTYILEGDRFSLPTSIVLDPETFRFSDTNWQIWAGNKHATSADGYNFTYQGTVCYRQEGTYCSVVADVVDFTTYYRMYIHGDSPSGASNWIQSLVSTDSRNWTLESGNRLTLDTSSGLESGGLMFPTVIKKRDGTYLMIYQTTIGTTNLPITRSLTITITGTGSGTVTSTPNGINCGSTCSTHFTSGITVTLTATPASGSTFAGWSGACSGSSTTCTVTMDAAKNVTATFNTGTTQCTYTISASPQTFSSSAGTGIVRVTPSSTNCNAEWYLTTDSSWLNFTYTCGSGICTSSTANGIGEGSASFKVDANSSSTQRTGTISLTGGNSVTITQDAGGSCTQCGISFSDVATTSYAYNSILAIGCAGITQGCGVNLYCPSQNVTRAQMAAFIVRAKEGEPPSDYCSSGSGFNDVASSDGFCKYIKRLSELQITRGCGNWNYCPSDVVTRGQMAAFIIRALYGENFSYTTTPYFSDVPSSNVFFKYVQKLKDEGITTATGVYNVDAPVTREQMAAFLYRAFLRQSCGG